PVQGQPAHRQGHVHAEPRRLATTGVIELAQRDTDLQPAAHRGAADDVPVSARVVLPVETGSREYQEKGEEDGGAHARRSPNAVPGRKCGDHTWYFRPPPAFGAAHARWSLAPHGRTSACAAFSWRRSSRPRCCR